MTDSLPSTATEQASAVRALYGAGRTLTEIEEATGLGRSRIYYWLDHDLGPDGRPRERPLPRRRVRKGQEPQQAMARRLRLAERIWRAAEAQVCEIEARMMGLGSAPAEAERDARALAVLARVVRELSVLDGAKAPKAAPAAPTEEDAHAPDARARDLDAFRRELARRLDALRGDGAD